MADDHRDAITTDDSYGRERVIADLLELATSEGGIDFYERGVMARAAGVIRELIAELEEANRAETP